MKKLTTIIFILFTTFGVYAQSDVAFPLGEKITFKVQYGWFTLGEASMSLGDELVYKNGKAHYSSKIEAGTVGMFSWLAGIENNYQGIVAVDNYKVIESEKHLNERDGKYDQWNVFDYKAMKTYVKEINPDKKDIVKTYEVDLTTNTYDIHGTYMYLRSQLGQKFKKGDSLMFKTYWHTKLYNFGMEYGGEEKIKFNGDKVKVKKYYGLFPISKTFPEERAVTVYILEKDGLGIPLLIEAQMRIGKVRCELKNYEIKGQTLMVSE
ncbi:DUF3108 domain-containing protein [Marinoscillum pacificum]|uniref:DUF3108 domain-containing protein n=1 Tax=Marinoscillum pacificum TaxID=392723 RepID=UPI002157CBEE|nr:DUF3108 domain-containing protein [Marinoscillum pacificum]